MNNTPVINVGLTPGELFIVPAPGMPMVALPPARYLARFEVLGRGEDWAACRVQEAALDTKQHRIVERIAVFSRREDAQSFVEHLSGLLMTTDTPQEEQTGPRVLRPERGLRLLGGMIIIVGLVAAVAWALLAN